MRSTRKRPLVTLIVSQPPRLKKKWLMAAWRYNDCYCESSRMTTREEEEEEAEERTNAPRKRGRRRAPLKGARRRNAVSMGTVS